MSFILDALKKSEAERQRQAGPTLLEVRITPPRRRYPPWLIVITALLLANVAVLLAFLLRRPASAAPASAPLAAASSAPAPVAASAARVVPQAAVDPAAISPAAAATTALAASAPSPANAAVSANAADDQPAIDPRTAGPSAATLPHEGIDFATLPSFQEVAGSVPDLRLDLHVYDDQPSKRYALINMHRVQEGEMLPEGVRVLAITAAGVALDYRGQQFMLHPQ
jgi:general secretion pathway protein B